MADRYSRVMLALIAAGVLVLAGERLWRGKVELYVSPPSCGSSWEPCKVELVAPVQIQNFDMLVPKPCGQSRWDACYVRVD